VADTTLKVLGIAGSLRQGSFNRGLLRAATGLMPEGATLETFDLQGLPPYNFDLESDLPPEAKRLRAAIKAADAILLVTPEYNYSVSGVLKNAIDWGSRPRGDNSWNGKPGAIMGASPGILGTARAQYHLRQILQSINVLTLNHPEIMVASADTKFDGEGNLQDIDTKQRIKKLLAALVAWTRHLKRGAGPGGT
jgi:chromate reductase, NAD(P)H dehydrogenase (quinone)